MRIGEVKEILRPVQSLPGTEGRNIVLLQEGQEELAALDLTGCRPGDRVLFLQGPAAARSSMAVPADAVVTAVLKKPEK